MSDVSLVFRLRSSWEGSTGHRDMMLEAADRIEKLEATLRQILDLDPPYETGNEVAFQMASIAHLVLEHDE